MLSGAFAPGGSGEAVSKLKIRANHAGRHDLGFWSERRRLAGKLLILQQNLPFSFYQAAETAALPVPQNDKFLSFETASPESPHLESSTGNHPFLYDIPLGYAAWGRMLIFAQAISTNPS